jgi:hypothetical protein
VGVGKVVIDVLDTPFAALAADRGGNLYVSETNGHMIVFPTAVPGATVPLQAQQNAPVNSTPVDFDLSGDAASNGDNASPNGFQIMTNDINNNLYGYVAGSGVITEFAFNTGYQFPPYIQGVIAFGLTPPSQCATGHSQCMVGNIPAFNATAGPGNTPAFTVSPPLSSPQVVLTSRLFPLPLQQFTLPATITNVIDIAVDIFGNIDVLSLNAGAPAVTQFAPCTPTLAAGLLTATAPSCTLVATKTISGSNTGFNTPGSIAVDTLTNIYVEDFNPAATTTVSGGTAAGFLNDFLVFSSQASGNVAPSLSFTAAPFIDTNSTTPLPNSNTNPVPPPPATPTALTPAVPGYGLGVY